MTYLRKPESGAHARVSILIFFITGARVKISIPNIRDVYTIYIRGSYKYTSNICTYEQELKN